MQYDSCCGYGGPRARGLMEAQAEAALSAKSGTRLVPRRRILPPRRRASASGASICSMAATTRSGRYPSRFATSRSPRLSVFGLRQISAAAFASNRANGDIQDCRIEGKIALDGRISWATTTSAACASTRGHGVSSAPTPFPQASRRASRMVHAAWACATAPFWMSWSGLFVALRYGMKVRTNSGVETSFGQEQQSVHRPAPLAVQPDILLMDEPGALDPVSTLVVEQLACELKKTCTRSWSLHNIQQAARISARSRFFLLERS